MLHCLILPTVSEPIHKVVNHFLVVLIGIDQSIGIVSTRCGERGGGTTGTSIDTLTSEVGVEDGHGLFLVAHVDHA